MPDSIPCALCGQDIYSPQFHQQSAVNRGLLVRCSTDGCGRWADTVCNLADDTKVYRCGAGHTQKHAPLE